MCVCVCVVRFFEVCFVLGLGLVLNMVLVLGLGLVFALFEPQVTIKNA